MLTAPAGAVFFPRSFLFIRDGLPVPVRPCTMTQAVLGLKGPKGVHHSLLWGKTRTTMVKKVFFGGGQKLAQGLLCYFV